jgi:hypothetical protein
MKILTLAVISIGALCALDSVAEPDEASTRSGQTVQTPGEQRLDTSGDKERASKPKKPLILPLDHGPHAVVTPWVNQQRRKRAEEEEMKNEGIESHSK